MNEEASNKYLPLKIKIVVNFNEIFDYPFYIKKPNGDFVEITINPALVKKTMEGYLDRGLTEIYLTELNLANLTKKIRETIEHKKNTVEALKNIESLYLNLRINLKKIGLTDFTLSIAEDINRAAISQIVKIPRLADVLVRFKTDCDTDFLKYIALSHISISMLDTFLWKSKPIDLKMGLAALLCDNVLSSEDFKIMNENSFDKWPEKLKTYPIKAAENLSSVKGQKLTEVIQMIEMHRELPDGTGFPKQLSFKNIPLLPAIFIVAYNVTGIFFKCNFNESQTEENLNEMYPKYSKGPFREASLSIFKCLGIVLKNSG